MKVTMQQAAREYSQIYYKGEWRVTNTPTFKVRVAALSLILEFYHGNRIALTATVFHI